jgi:hypothetical protein
MRALAPLAIGALACAMVWTTATAEDPDRVRPSTETVAQLRAAVADVANTVGEKFDLGHDWLYRRLQYLIEDVDTRFAPADVAPIVVPLSPLRIGLDGDLLHRQHGLGLAATRDFEATLRVPNLERRLNVFVSNADLAESPRDSALEHNPVRAGLRFAPHSHVEFEMGARAKVWPSAFAAVRWASEFSGGPLHIYPFAKAYAESGLGFGASGGLAVERWGGRWVARSASYANWVRNTAATDWTQTVILGYARAVIQQRRYDRLADGHDLACGVVARLAVAGDRVSRTSSYEASVLFKRPLHGGWLFGYAGPVVRWDRNTTWHPDIGIGAGLDVLFWGLATRPAELATYCN